MKLSKSQRLFVKAGECLDSIKRWKWKFKLNSIRNGFDNHDSWGLAYGIRERKKVYKKLLREAIEVAKTENETIYGEGLAEAFKSHLE